MPTRKNTKHLESKRSIKHDAYIFDACTLLLYANREQTLLKQLCCGDARLSYRLLHANIEQFLGSSHPQQVREARAIKDKDELCHFLRMHMTRQTFVRRIIGVLHNCGTSLKVALMKWLLSNYYFKSIMNQMRTLLNQQVYQFLYFIPTQGMGAQRAYFQSLMRMMYGEEFWLVHSVHKLTRVYRYFSHFSRQLSFMMSHKGFELDDLFSKRNPNYLVATHIHQHLLKAVKAKCVSVMHSCTFWLDHCRKHKAFQRQSKAHRDFERQQQQDAREEKRLKLEEEKVGVSYEKVNMMRERNRIELAKVQRM